MQGKRENPIDLEMYSILEKLIILLLYNFFVPHLLGCTCIFGGKGWGSPIFNSIMIFNLFFYKLNIICINKKFIKNGFSFGRKH